MVDGTGIVLGGDAKTMAKLHLQAVLCEAFESSEEVSLDLCLPLPKDLSQALLHAAQAVAGKATSWSPVLAEILKPTRFLNKKPKVVLLMATRNSQMPTTIWDVGNLCKIMVGKLPTFPSPGE